MRTTIMVVTLIWVVGNGGVPENKATGLLLIWLIGLAWALYWDIRQGNKS